jgi:glutathione peroxidase
MEKLFYLMRVCQITAPTRWRLSVQNIYDFKANSISGKEISLSDFKGKVLLVVNTASQCGFTPQYDGLEELYKKHSAQGLEILGFPCNQFGSQEPGTDSEIASFCTTRFSVNFPMFSKIDVNGANQHPLYEYLKKAAKGVLGTEAIKWNFTKFLVSRQGKVLHRYAPTTAPKDIEADILKALAQQAS